MKQFIPQQLLLFYFFLSSFVSNINKEKISKPDRLAIASCENRNGWVYVHPEGSPSDIDTNMVSGEIDTTLQMPGYFPAHETKNDWQFYRGCEVCI